MIQLGILLALASAFVANLGLLCKYRGAMAAPTVELKHPLRSAAGLFRSRWWLIGFAVATVGWTFHVAALSVAPLSLVETTLSGGILLLAWIAERWFGVKVGPREWVGVALCAIGLVLLALTSAGHGGASSRYSVEAMALFEAGAVGVGTALLLSGSAGVPGRASGPLLGIAAGLMLGVANVAVKALTGTVPGDPIAIVSPWAFTALAAGVGAFLALGRGLQTGGAIPGDHAQLRDREPDLRGRRDRRVRRPDGHRPARDRRPQHRVRRRHRGRDRPARSRAGRRRSGLDPAPGDLQCVTLVLTRLRSDSLTGPFFSRVEIAAPMSSWNVSTNERLRFSLTRARIIFTSWAFGGIV